MIDVVILSWGRPEETIRCIESVFRQKEIAYTIYIIDQGSAAKELEILEKYAKEKDIILRKLGKNVGVPAGRNTGMKMGTNSYIFVIDNDAEIIGEYTFYKIIERFQSEDKIGIIGFKILNADMKIDSLSWVYPKSMLEKSDEYFLTTRFVGAGHAILREGLEKTQMYDEKLFFTWEEMDLSYQFIQEGYKIVYDPSIEILHHVSPNKRIKWSGGRYRIFCRNSVYIQKKYFGYDIEMFKKIIGYSVKGYIILKSLDGFRGVIDGIIMKKNSFSQKKLSKYSKKYCREHEMLARGGFLKRVRNELLGKLVGQ